MALGLGAVLGLAALALTLLDILLWPTLKVMAEAEMQNMAVSGMYQAVQKEVAASGLDYRTLFRVETNEAGQVTFMQPDTAAVNSFAARVAASVQAELVALDGRRIYIPLGRALGSRLLGSLGPRIPVRISPAMVGNVRIWDTFEAAGINQTRHRIYLTITVTARMAIPFIGSDVPVTSDFPIAEAIIVGEVPNTYVGGMWMPFFPRDGGATPGPGTSSGTGSP